jgi:hypothetical protein
VNEATGVVEGDTSLLDAIEVKKPDNCVARTKKYYCGIKEWIANGTAPEREIGANPGKGIPPIGPHRGFELHLGVGNATFCTQTFAWDGVGDDAKQVFKKGAIQEFSPEEVAEIQAKLQHRYLRLVRHPKTHDLLGFRDVDASNGGAFHYSTPDPENTAFLKEDKDGPRPVRRVPGRLSGDEMPLKDILVFHNVMKDERTGTMFTVSDLKRLLAEAEAEERRELEEGGTVFDKKPGESSPTVAGAAGLDTGNGGKLEVKSAAQAKKDAKLLDGLNKTTNVNKSQGGYIPG